MVLIGANGAGKTTTLKAISGLVKSEPESYAKLDLSMLSDKRTLNRFAGKKMTDLLLKVYDTSEMAFQKIRSEEDITAEVFGKITKWNYLKIKKIRKNYYNFYAKKTWADKASYDMLIDSSRISEKELAAMLRALLTARGVELETDGSDQ